MISFWNIVRTCVNEVSGFDFWLNKIISIINQICKQNVLKVTTELARFLLLIPKDRTNQWYAWT